MTTLILAPGEKLIVQFADCDGEFELHFDTPEYRQQVVIKETAGLPGSEVGDAFAVLYCEDFSKAQESLGTAHPVAEPFPVFQELDSASGLPGEYGTIELTSTERMVLSVLDTDGGLVIGDVAKKVTSGSEQTPRQHTAYIRTLLLGLEGKGLVKQMDDAKPVCWLRTK